MLEGLILSGFQYRDTSEYCLDKGFLDNVKTKFDNNKFIGGLTISGRFYDEKTQKHSWLTMGRLDFYAYNLKNLDFNYFYRDFETAVKESGLYDAIVVDSENTGIDDLDIYYSIFKQGYSDSLNYLSHDEWDRMSCLENDTYLIALDSISMKPEYQNMGIEEYVYKNLFQIFYTHFNIVALFVVGTYEEDKVLEGFRLFECQGKSSFCKCIYDNSFLEDIKG